MDLDGNVSACWFHCEQKADESTCHSGKVEFYLCALQLVAKNTFYFYLCCWVLRFPYCPEGFSITWTKMFRHHETCGLLWRIIQRGNSETIIEAKVIFMATLSLVPSLGTRMLSVHTHLLESVFPWASLSVLISPRSLWAASSPWLSEQHSAQGWRETCPPCTSPQVTHTHTHSCMCINKSRIEGCHGAEIEKL